MAISRVKTWTTNEDLTSSDLNAEFNQAMNNAANTGSAETISSRYTFSAGIILDELVATNAAGSGNVKLSEFRWDPASGTAADGDGMYIDWLADDAGGTETIMARTGVELTDTDASGEDAEFEIHAIIAASLTKVASFGSAGNVFSRDITVGTAGSGHDVTFYGDTSGKHMLWDQSADELALVGATKLSFYDAAGGENIVASADGHLEVNAGTTLDITAPTVDLNSSTEFNIDTAAYDLNASGAVTIDSAGVSIDSSAASNLTTSGGALTITSAAAATWSTAAGALTLGSGAALNITPAAGSAIVLDGTISVDAGVVTGATSITSTAFVGDITGDVTGNVDTFTATANNSANETVYPVFVDGATGAQGAETDTGLTYNPSTGLLSSAAVTTTGVVTAGGFTIGSAVIVEAELETIDGVTAGTVAASKAVVVDGSKDAGTFGTVTAGTFVGALTGNASGTAATVTGGTQAAITAAANLVTVGALNAGSITSGFGTIDTGSSTITTTGTVSTGSIDLQTTGNRIDIDTDNDASIRASADDVLTIELGGADWMAFSNKGVYSGSAGPSLALHAGDMGNNNMGNVVAIGRNTNGTNSAAGMLVMEDKSGTAHYIWVEDSGELRISSAHPYGTTDASAGVRVGAQS